MVESQQLGMLGVASQPADTGTGKVITSLMLSKTVWHGSELVTAAG